MKKKFAASILVVLTALSLWACGSKGTEVENSVYRLANAIRKTQRRANALENILIPRYRETAKFITAALEEKEREEFSRMKVIKATKMANS